MIYIVGQGVYIIRNVSVEVKRRNLKVDKTI